MMAGSLRKQALRNGLFVAALALGSAFGAACTSNTETNAPAKVGGFGRTAGRGQTEAPVMPEPPTDPKSLTPNQRVDAIGEEVLAIELAAQPVMGTWLGVHSGDDRLDDVRLDVQAQRAARLRMLADRLRTLPEAELDSSHRIDRSLLDLRIATELYELVELRPLERSPLWYAEIAANGIDELLAHDAEPLADQVRPLSSRLWKMRPFFDEARRNLRNTASELSTRRAVEVLQATQSFIVDVLPKVIAPVADPKAFEDFRAASSDANRALEDFAGWLGRDLQPRARGDLSLGRDRYLQKLKLYTGVESPPEQLLFLADAELREAKRRGDDLARQIAPGRPLAEAQKIIDDDHAKAEELVPSAQASLQGILDGLRARQIFDITDAESPRLAEMPPERWGMLQPRLSGLLESRPEPPLLWVDPVEPRWPEKRKNEQLRALNRAAMTVAMTQVLARTILHERTRHAPTTALKLAAAPSFVEGWPLLFNRLYLASLPPGELRPRYVEARQAQQHAVRLLAALRYHALGQRLDDIVRLFSDELGFDEYQARREAERVALDPLSGIECLGRVELELIERDLRSALPQATTAQILARMSAHGTPPLYVLRRLLNLEK